MWLLDGEPAPSDSTITRFMRGHLAEVIEDLVQTLICKRHANILCLTAINTATESPTAVFVGTVIDEALLAEEALAAEGFHVNRNSVAGLYVRNRRADLFHDADHLVTDRDSFHRPRHAAVLDM